jgi:hypothetical protein
LRGVDEDEDEGGGVGGDHEIDGRIEGKGGVDCKSGTNKVSREVNSVPTVTVPVGAALLIAVSNMTTET